MAKIQAQSDNAGSEAPPPGGPLRALEAALEGAFRAFVRLLRRRAPDIALALAVIGGLLLVYAETLDLYRVVTPGGVTSNATGSIQTGADQHSWALGVIGVVIAAAAVLARWTGQRLPAWAAVALAVIALGIVLAVDLPDVTSAGLTTELEPAEAQPRGGFWAELVGALVALVGAAALALQLSRRAIAPRRRP